MLNDLSLIPLEDLLKEIEKRCVTFVAAWETYHDKGTTKNMSFQYGKGNWADSIHLSTILQNDVLNNWANELKTLQRINEEQGDSEI